MTSIRQLTSLPLQRKSGRVELVFRPERYITILRVAKIDGCVYDDLKSFCTYRFTDELYVTRSQTFWAALLRVVLA